MPSTVTAKCRCGCWPISQRALVPTAPMTQPGMDMGGTGVPAFGAAQPANYQPLFNSNGQVTGQTGGFQPVPPVNQAMETDNHGVPGFLKRKK